METHNITATHQGDMAFEAEVNAHTLVMDAAEDVGGHDAGPRPKPMVLAALAGCTGMDVVSLLKKMRVPYNSFAVHVTGQLTDEHPKTYHTIHVVYQLTGPELASEAHVANIEKAVRLSQEKYCGVSALLRKATNLTYEVRLDF
jgi:putative redox protein